MCTGALGLYKRTKQALLHILWYCFNLVLKNKLTKITLNCNGRQIKLTFVSRGGIAVLNVDYFTNVYKKNLLDIHKSRKHSFKYSKLHSGLPQNHWSSSYKKGIENVFIYVYFVHMPHFG